MEILSRFRFFLNFSRIPISKGFGRDIKLQSAHLSATFDVESGLLTDLKLANGPLRKMQIKFKKYGTTGRMDKSGAYLFMPDGQASVKKIS